MTLEDRLRRALRRVEPDADFASRVMARLDAPRVATARSRARRPLRYWALAASVVLAVGLGVLVGHERAESRRAAAVQQLAFALELTGRELQNVHRHLEPTPNESQENGT